MVVFSCLLMLVLSQVKVCCCVFQLNDVKCSTSVRRLQHFVLFCCHLWQSYVSGQQQQTCRLVSRMFCLVIGLIGLEMCCLNVAGKGCYVAVPLAGIGHG